MTNTHFNVNKGAPISKDALQKVQEAVPIGAHAPSTPDEFIEARYWALGGTTWGVPTAKDPGRMWTFPTACICYDAATGQAWEIYGGIYQHWLALGGLAFGVPCTGTRRPGWGGPVQPLQQRDRFDLLDAGPGRARRLRRDSRAVDGHGPREQLPGIPNLGRGAGTRRRTAQHLPRRLDLLDARGRCVRPVRSGAPESLPSARRHQLQRLYPRRRLGGHSPER